MSISKECWNLNFSINFFIYIYTNNLYITILKIKINTYIYSIKSQHKPSKVIRYHWSKNFCTTLHIFVSFKLLFLIRYIFKPSFNHRLHHIILWKINFPVYIILYPFFLINQYFICHFYFHKFICCIFLIFIWVIFSWHVTILFLESGWVE